LVLAYENGLDINPKVVAELGPGDSFGMGLAALLCGAQKYYAFDVVEFSQTERNLKILDEIIDLFNRRADIPDNNEFPKVKPYLESYEFPKYILTDGRLDRALAQERINSIKKALQNSGEEQGGIKISYFVPWYDKKLVEPGTVDMIFSQAVMEHVDNLPYAYKSMYDWLRPGGFMSHQIDFKCHGTAYKWSGHWAYSDRVWQLIIGKGSYLLNREPYSTHIRFIKENNFKIVCDKRVKNDRGISRGELAPRFKNFSDEDLLISGTLIQVKK